MDKMIKASTETGITEVAIAGGVSANSGLRETFQSIADEKGWNTYIPAFQYCTDNAGMIAVAAHFNYLAGKTGDLAATPAARMPF